MKKSIYLDFNATGVLRPEVRQALISHLDQDGNPPSVHQRG
ncbi:MAG: aminotransferase, partial [Proteobacteria bacterium]|nr:aminotransferase [Pseudomonadota bacterium]